MPDTFTTPTMRIVQGSVFEPQLTDQQGKPRVYRDGPKAGQPNPQWFVAGAISKNDPAWPPFKAKLDAESSAAWPSLHPGGVRIPGVVFSDKIIDGDGYDTTGKHNGAKEGFAGHWVVRFTSGYAPKVVQPSGPGTWLEVTNPKAVKTGDYVRIAGTLASNMQPTKPGIYVNLSLVEFVGQGAAIVSGPSAADAFAQPAALPPGATALPAATGPIPGAATAPPPPPGAPAAPAPPPPPPAPPAPPAPPYAGYMQVHDPLAAAAADGWIAHPSAPGHFYKGQDVKAVADLAALYPAPAAAAAPPAPPPPPPAPPAQPAAVYTMTAKAAGQTREAMNAAQWTDDLLLQHGYMTINY